MGLETRDFARGLSGFSEVLTHAIEPPERRFTRLNHQPNPFAVVQPVSSVAVKPSRLRFKSVGPFLLTVLMILVGGSNLVTGLAQRAWGLWQAKPDPPPAVVPLDYDRISSPYGQRNGRLHQGIDFAAQLGTPIRAGEAGKVVYAGWRGGYGQLIELEHASGRITRYAHCSEILVKEGITVGQGETLGKVGSTGRSTGPHLHFEVLEQGRFMDPLDYFALNGA